MKTSALVPCYNAAPHLGECLDSLREFDEVLFLDDGSSDGSEAIAAAFGHVTILPSQGHRGQGATKRSLIQASVGDAVVVCDADDYLLPIPLLDRCAPLLRPEVLLTMAPVVNLATGRINRTWGDLWQLALRLQAIPCGTTWRGEVLRSLVEEELEEGAVDHQLLLRLLQSLPAPAHALAEVRHIGGAPVAAYRADWSPGQAHHRTNGIRQRIIEDVWSLTPASIVGEAHRYYYEKTLKSLGVCV
jgi:hypothetical protein